MIKAIEIDYKFTNGAKDYIVMVAHAGRSARSGAKVHLATMTVWPNGNITTSGTRCSNNGQLRGTIVSNRDFSAVTCARCGNSPEAAERRNAQAIEL